MAGEDRSRIAERVAALFPAGAVLSNDWTSAGCRAGQSEVTVLATRAGDERLYGVPVALDSTGHEFYYGAKFPVESLDEWLESVALGFMVMFETGYAYHARRRLVGDYIELRAEGGWPADDRFYLYHYAPRGGTGFRRLVTDPDLDVSLPNETIEQGRLVEWVIATENNTTGGPHLGQAVVAHDQERGAVLELLECLEGVPHSVRLELARSAVFGTGPRYDTVVTDLQDPVLAVLGFSSDTNGGSRVATDLLAADPDQARQMVMDEISHGPVWGCDRDLSGRPLPASRIGRGLHRLRWPRSGQWLRTSWQAALEHDGPPGEVRLMYDDFSDWPLWSEEGGETEDWARNVLGLSTSLIAAIEAWQHACDDLYGTNRVVEGTAEWKRRRETLMEGGAALTHRIAAEVPSASVTFTPLLNGRVSSDCRGAKRSNRL